MSEAPGRTRLSALVVNYNSGAFAERCVESLLRDWALEGRRREDLDVVVVDNDSPEEQEPFLANIEALGATVIRHDENAGYAKAINMAYARTAGGPEDIILILNPDIFMLPGSVGKMIAFLHANPDVGVVDPRTTIDHQGVLNLPRNTLPTVVDQVRIAGAQLSRALCRAYSRRRIKLAIPWWTEHEPIDSDMLSGCCLFMRRAVANELPSLMDDRYPLYYEDTDLFTTLLGKGYRVVHHGGVHVLHHWSRSASPGGAYGGETLKKYQAAQREYFLKFHGSLGWGIVSACNWLGQKWPAERSFRPMHPITELGDFVEPVVIPLPRSCDYLLELTMAPSWLLTVGILGSGDRWVCPPETWEWFFQTYYYMRALDLKTREVLGAWHFTKSTPGRSHPLEPHEIDALFGPHEEERTAGRARGEGVA